MPGNGMLPVGASGLLPTLGQRSASTSNLGALRGQGLQHHLWMTMGQPGPDVGLQCEAQGVQCLVDMHTGEAFRCGMVGNDMLPVASLTGTPRLPLSLGQRSASTSNLGTLRGQGLPPYPWTARTFAGMPPVLHFPPSTSPEVPAKQVA